MNYYEKVVILDPNLDDGAVEETIEKIRNVIINQGGEIFKTDNWGRRKLAYELNKHQKGNYVLLHFKSPPSVIAELEKLCKVIDSIIKFMVVKLTKKRQIEAILPSPSDKAGTEETKPEQKQAEQAGESVTPAEGTKNV